MSCRMLHSVISDAQKFRKTNRKVWSDVGRETGPLMFGRCVSSSGTTTTTTTTTSTTTSSTSTTLHPNATTTAAPKSAAGQNQGSSSGGGNVATPKQGGGSTFDPVAARVSNYKALKSRLQDGADVILWSEGKVGQTTYWPFYGTGEEHVPLLVDTLVDANYLNTLVLRQRGFGLPGGGRARGGPAAQRIRQQIFAGGGGQGGRGRWRGGGGNQNQPGGGRWSRPPSKQAGRALGDLNAEAGWKHDPAEFYFSPSTTQEEQQEYGRAYEEDDLFPPSSDSSNNEVEEVPDRLLQLTTTQSQTTTATPTTIPLHIEMIPSKEFFVALHTQQIWADQKFGFQLSHCPRQNRRFAHVNPVEDIDTKRMYENLLLENHAQDATHWYLHSPLNKEMAEVQRERDRANGTLLAAYFENTLSCGLQTLSCWQPEFKHRKTFAPELPPGLFNSSTEASML